MGSNTTWGKSLRASTAPNRKKWQARLPLQCAATQPPTAVARRLVAPWPTSAVPARLAATPLLIRWPTPAKEELPVVTRPAAVPRGHVGPAPVVEETRRAVKGLVDEKSTKHDKTQQSSKDLCIAAYIYQISICGSFTSCETKI